MLIVSLFKTLFLCLSVSNRFTTSMQIFISFYLFFVGGIRAGAGAVTLLLLSCLLHVYLFIEINYLIQGLVMGSTTLRIIILLAKVRAASLSHEFI